MSLEGWSEGTFTHEERTRTVFQRGTGPGVLVMHEMPGITPAVERFARRVADDGFTVAMPVLFGVPGKPPSVGYTLGTLARGCVSAEFAVFAANRSSPIVAVLRALGRQLHAQAGGRGIGALGMCFTGNFALALAVDPWVEAPVLSQPSLPFLPPSGAHASPEELAAVRARRVPVLGLRFTGDLACRQSRFDTFRRELPGQFEAVEIDSSLGNPKGIPRTAHSVVSHHFVDEEGHPTKAALDRVLTFFHERLD